MFIVLVLTLLVAVMTKNADNHGSEKNLVGGENDMVELAELDEFSNHTIVD